MQHEPNNLNHAEKTTFSKLVSFQESSSTAFFMLIATSSTRLMSADKITSFLGMNDN